MKKFSVPLFINIAIASIIPATSCQFRNHINGKDGIINADDYDWTITNDYDKESRVTNILDNFNESNILNIAPKNLDNSLNFNKISTGYRDQNQILMQSATGAPLSNAFDFTGNVKSDFGFNDFSSKYTRINKILDWSPDNDADAKYDKSTVPLLKREPIGTKWNTSENDNIKYMNLGRQYAGRFNNADGNNTITSQQKIFQQNFTNWQMTDSYVWWRGTIGIPDTDFVDFAHKNGSAVYGFLYLDGFYGLKPGMLDDLLERDSNGNFVIVSKLIEMAKYYGFDGYFLNEEANGPYIDTQPVLRYQDVIELLSQFKEKAKDSGIKITSYTNAGTLEYDSDGLLPINNKSVLYAKNSDNFLTDFGDYAPSNETYVNNNATDDATPDNSFTYYKGEKSDYSVYNMWDHGSDSSSGKYQAASRNGSPLYWDDMSLNKNGGAINSIAIFGSQSAWEMSSEYFTPKATDLVGSDIIRMIRTESIDDGFYDGSDHTVRGSWYDKNMYNKIYSTPFGDDRDKIKSDNKDKSFGVANLVTPKTPIIDGISSINSNFSIGEGKKFIDENFIDVNDSNKYTWFNRGLGDLQPTYKWDLFNVDDGSPIIASEGITGYYDFDQVYKKGNSIALGSGYYDGEKTTDSVSNQTKYPGRIEDATYQPNINYGWNIMGANLTSNDDYDVSFTYKITQNGVQNDSTKSIDDDVNLMINSNEILDNQNSSRNTDENGWTTVTCKINPKDYNNLISSFGLNLSKSDNPQTFKINVGQFNITKSGTSTQTRDDVSISNFNSEYTIVRDKNKTINIRMDWSSTDDDKVEYYEIYYKLNGKIYRYGETNHTNYWMGDINIESILNNHDPNFQIIIRPVVDGANNTSYTKINLNIEGIEK